MNIKKLCGWNEALAKENFRLFGARIPRYADYVPVIEPRGERRMLWEYTRQVLGADTLNYGQESGDCVSFGGKNCLEYIECVEISLNKDAEKFRSIFPPYFYGTSRVQIGGGRINGAGSLGTWLEQASRKYGVLAADENGVPTYSGRIADSWGRTGPPQKFIDIASKNLIGTTSLVKNKNEAADAIWKGYPIAICSSQGFNMDASADGFHAARGQWAHCMTLIGFGTHPTYGLYFIILNSWGDAHGRLKDFETGEDLPIGVLRVKGSVVDRMLSENDSFAFSMFDGYPDQSDKLTRNDFIIMGRK